MTIRILIADDEPNQLELLSYNLSSADFEVLRASDCLLYTSPSPRDKRQSRMPSSA